MLKQFSEEELFRRPHSELQKEELLALLDKPDDAIDTSDIPEIRELPSTAIRGRFYRGPAVFLTEELRRYFADLARRKGVPMNDLVNETLAKAVAAGAGRPLKTTGGQAEPPVLLLLSGESADAQAGD